ncbi:MAG: radical SAM protein [Candidatus Omnitrophota bacterium]
MSDVVFIHSPMLLYKNEDEKARFRSHGGDEKSYYPLGILYIASYLKKYGHTARVIDVAAQGRTLVDILEIIKAENPKIIGISSMTTSIMSAVKLAESIKEKFGDKFQIGLGGVHLCVDPEFVNRFPVFDFGLSGEGEKTFEELVRKAKKGERIKGLIQGEMIEDLDTLPFPARDMVETGIYLREEQMNFEVPAAGILGSRGCPFLCAFCCIPAIGHKVRIRSPKNVVDEMEQVYDQCRGSYSFVDDCFILNKSRILEFCQEIIDRKIKVKFIGSTRASTLDEEIAMALHRAGCTDLYFGVESGNERVRNQVIKKKVSDKQIADAILLCRKYRIMTNLFLMVGFPTETKSEMLDTAKIGKKVKADIIGIHITIPFPGTEVFRYAVDHKMIPSDIVDKYARGQLGSGFRGVWPLFVPEGCTLRDLINIKKKAYMSFYLDVMWWMRRIRTWFLIRGKFKEDLKLFKIALHVFRTGGTKGQLS